MGLREEFRDFVITLPGVNDPAERRAVVSSTRPTDMVTHLDFQGSDFAFANGLVTELGRRDKAALLEFLGTLYGALDPGLETQQKLDAFRDQVAALDDAGFKAEFPAPLAAGVAAPPPKPDAAILAGALVGDVLAPHYALGAVPRGCVVDGGV